MERTGSAGGKATRDKYGVEHFRELGRKGFESFTARYFSGDRQQAGDWLRARAHEARLDTYVEKELQRRLDGGMQITSEEIPCFTDPDDCPF